MSRVIKAAIWKEQPWLIEVPPLPEPAPEAVIAAELNDEPIEKASTYSEKKYALYVQMKVEAERQKVEAENMLAAVRQEQENLYNKTAEKLQTMKQEAENKAATVRQQAEDELASARNEAEEILKKAEEDAAAIKAEAEEMKKNMISDAEEEAAELKEKAKEAGKKEGFEQGRKEGTEQALSEQKQAILDANAKAEKTIKDAEYEKDSYVQKAEEEIVELVFQVASKILPQHFIDVPQVILPLVQKALMKIKDQSRILIHVAPAHYDFVLIAKNELQASLEGSAVLEVTSDASLGIGDVFLESPNGDVDARLETQLELVKKAVQDVIA